MPRYATIITDDDGHEIVSAIGEFEGAAPTARTGRIELVAPGVLIGMVKGGPVDAAGGFGFPRGTLGVNGRAVGLARAHLKVRSEAGAAQSEAAQGNAAPKAAVTSTEIEAGAAKPVRRAAKARPARSKSGKRKTARTGKAARVTPPSEDTPHG
jgi:hypothetical protein